MRASILTLIFIISEYSIITGGDGNCGKLPTIANAVIPDKYDTKFRMNCSQYYLRRAGTSNLFRCSKNKWENTPPLVCIPDPTLKRSSTTHRTPTVTTQARTTSTVADTTQTVATLTDTPRSPVTPSWSASTAKTHNMTTQPKTTSTLGHPAITPTHKTSTTSQTYCVTSEMTTKKEETSVTTTSKTSTHTASTTTENEHLTTVSPQTRTSLFTTSPVSENGRQNPNDKISGDNSKGITAGIVIVVIIAILAATVAVLFWRPCTRFRRARGPSVEMTIQNPGSDQPLITPHPVTGSCPLDSVQSPVSPFTDSPEGTCTNAHLSA